MFDINQIGKEPKQNLVEVKVDDKVVAYTDLQHPPITKLGPGEFVVSAGPTKKQLESLAKLHGKLEIKGVHLKDSFFGGAIHKTMKNGKEVILTVNQSLKKFQQRLERLQKGGRISKKMRFHFTNTRTNRKLVENNFRKKGYSRQDCRDMVARRIRTKNGKSFIRKNRRFTIKRKSNLFRNIEKATDNIINKRFLDDREILLDSTISFERMDRGGFAIVDALKSRPVPQRLQRPMLYFELDWVQLRNSLIKTDVDSYIVATPDCSPPTKEE